MTKKEISLKFDWLELVLYIGPTCLQLFHAWTLYSFQSQVPYFFLNYIVIAVLDLYAPKYLKNHSDNEQSIREKDVRFLIPLYLAFITYWIELYFVFQFMAYVFDNFTFLKGLLSFLMLWLTQGGEIILGHELGHRKNWIHRFFGYLLYLRFLNTNFIITHNKGHHKWVATPLDPGSAVKGQTVFQFAAHSIPNSVAQGWNIEVERIKKKYGHSVSPFLTVVLNQVFLMKLGELVYLAVVTYFWGFRMLCFSLVMAFLLQFGLEIINYIEHYGLRRKQIAPGKYERVSIRHSWNSAYSLNNILHFRLPRHSDHHQTGSKPYQALQNSEDSPQLPFSYTLAYTLALNTKLWFKAIDPLVEIYQEEKRKPTAEEEEKCKGIAKEAAYTAIAQNAGIILISLLV